MHCKAKNAPELISEHALFKNFLGEHALRPLYFAMYLQHKDKPSPLKTSLFTYLPAPPPLPQFVNATLFGVHVYFDRKVHWQ